MDHGGTPRDPLPAARMMADVLKAELGVQAEAEVIVAMFRKRWQTLSNLAHSIHNAIEWEATHLRREIPQPDFAQHQI
ncbi:MAG TPA: hypothetical protein VEA41_20785 [Salinarimonas sp.]|nr:hypothetical protein [Salinarimonas sp.]